MRGITFSAADALEMGLVDAIVPKSEVLSLSIAFANALPVNFQQADRALCLYKFLKPLHAKS